MKLLTLFAFWAICIVGMLTLCAGCQQIDPATQKKIHDAQQKAAIDAAKVKTAQQVKDVKASGNPVLHPFAANDETIREIRTGCIWLARVATVAAVVLFGLTFSPWGIFVKAFVIPAALLAGVGWVGVFALPFLPWVLGAVALGLIGWLIAKMVEAHSVLKGIQEWLAEIIALMHSHGGVTVEKVVSK